MNVATIRDAISTFVSRIQLLQHQHQSHFLAVSKRRLLRQDYPCSSIAPHVFTTIVALKKFIIVVISAISLLMRKKLH